MHLFIRVQLSDLDFSRERRDPHAVSPSGFCLIRRSVHLTQAIDRGKIWANRYFAAIPH
jgi:hypothetical protein